MPTRKGGRRYGGLRHECSADLRPALAGGRRLFVILPSANHAELGPPSQHEAQRDRRPSSGVAVLVSPETDRPSTIILLYQKKAPDNVSLALGPGLRQSRRNVASQSGSRLDLGATLALAHRKTSWLGNEEPRLTDSDRMKSTLNALGPRSERPGTLLGSQCQICR